MDVALGYKLVSNVLDKKQQHGQKTAAWTNIKVELSSTGDRTLCMIDLLLQNIHQHQNSIELAVTLIKFKSMECKPLKNPKTKL